MLPDTPYWRSHGNKVRETGCAGAGTFSADGGVCVHHLPEGLTEAFSLRVQHKCVQIGKSAFPVKTTSLGTGHPSLTLDCPKYIRLFISLPFLKT